MTFQFYNWDFETLDFEDIASIEYVSHICWMTSIFNTKSSEQNLIWNFGHKYPLLFMIYLKDYPPFMYKSVSSLTSLSELQADMLLCW